MSYSLVGVPIETFTSEAAIFKEQEAAHSQVIDKTAFLHIPQSLRDGMLMVSENQTAMASA